MSLLAKVLVVIQTVLVMVYLGMTASLYQHRRDWRTSYLKLKGRYSTAVTRSQKEIEALRSFVQAKSELVSAKEREVRQLKTQLDQGLQMAQRYHNLYNAESDKLGQLLEKHGRLADDLKVALEKNASLNERNEELDNLLDTATTRRATAEGQVARLTILKDELEADIKTLRATYAETRKKLREKELLVAMVENAGVNIASLVPGPPVPAIDGTVVAVKSDIQPPLVLLSVGSDDQVEQGFEFSIYRNDKFVGKVVVERVLNDSAGCRVLFTADGQAIQQGDSAATRLQ